jgi:hypothetical protein
LDLQGWVRSGLILNPQVVWPDKFPAISDSPMPSGN